MTSLTKEPKLPVVAGCLKGLTSLMVHFTKCMDEGLNFLAPFKAEGCGSSFQICSIYTHFTYVGVSVGIC